MHLCAFRFRRAYNVGLVQETNEGQMHLHAILIFRFLTSENSHSVTSYLTNRHSHAFRFLSFCSHFKDVPWPINSIVLMAGNVSCQTMKGARGDMKALEL